MFVALVVVMVGVLCNVCVWDRDIERQRERKAECAFRKKSIRSVFSLQGWSLNILFDSSELKRRQEKKKKKKKKPTPVCKRAGVSKGSPLHMIAPFTLFIYGFCGVSPIIQSCAWNEGFESTPINAVGISAQTSVQEGCVQDHLEQRYSPVLTNLVMDILVVFQWTRQACWFSNVPQAFAGFCHSPIPQFNWPSWQCVVWPVWSDLSPHIKVSKSGVSLMDCY